MSVVVGNDSHFFLRGAKESSYGVLPAQVLTITGVPTGGTLTLTHRGLTTAAIAYNANVAAIQSAINTAWGSGVCTASGAGALPANPITFTFASGPTAANPMLQAFAVSADISGLTGGTPVATWTGGPVWVLFKVPKVVPPDHKPNFLFDEEERNSADKLFEDSATQGGAIGNWKWQAGIRPDQVNHYLAMAGLTDSVATVGGETVVYDHTNKGGAGDGRSYTLQCFDGKITTTSCGVVLTDLKLQGKAGESGRCEVDCAGWGFLPDIDDSGVLAPTLPSNTAYKKLAPANSGWAVTLASGSTSLLQDWMLDWKRDAKPVFTQTGTVYPKRAEYGKRSLAGDITIIGDDATEIKAARAGTAPRNLVITMPGVETIGTASKPTVTINVPAFKYADYTDDIGRAAARFKFKVKAFYNTSAASQWVVTVRNEDSAAY